MRDMECARAVGERSGQAMLIAVLSLGGAILGATAIAGVILLYQIRATTDSENSAKAIFAADAGVEWSLFDYYCSTDGPGVGGRCPSVKAGTTNYTLPTFSNQATLDVECYRNLQASGATTTCSSPTTAAAITTGVSNGAERAFFLGVIGSTTTYP